ncbi:MAG: phytanoyl-CoA dioxygenase family protein [Alphaproteobacteria bacterium]
MTEFPITEAHERLYRDEGYFILERVFSDDVLDMLREECDRSIGIVEEAMDATGQDVIGLNHRGQRYIVPLQYKRSDNLPGFLFGEEMAALCRATLGPDAYLFLEQFVIKGARDGMALGWHQDAGYLPFDPPHYATGWIPLDDVDERNGTLYILPYSTAGTRRRVVHERQPGSNDKVGYFGDDPGIAVVAPAGSLAVISSTTLHRSGPNETDRPRRAYIVQYSERPIVYPDGGGLRHFADPFLKGGRRVSQPTLEELKRAPAMPWTWDE